MKAFLVYSIDDDSQLEIYGCRLTKHQAELLREEEGKECEEPTEIFIEEISID